MAIKKDHFKSVLGKVLATNMKLDNEKFVAQVEGKGLSANDFTDNYKAMLEHLNSRGIILGVFQSSYDDGLIVAVPDDEEEI